MRDLVSNVHFIWQVRNSSGTRFHTRGLIRLVSRNHRRSFDMQGVTNALAIRTLRDTTKAGHSTEPLPAKHRKRGTTKRKKPAGPKQEAYRSIGPVPSEPGLLEVGGLPASPSPPRSSAAIHQNGIVVVRSSMKMRKCGRIHGKTEGLRFNRPTVVEDRYCKLSGQLELLMTEREGVKWHVPRRVG